MKYNYIKNISKTLAVFFSLILLSTGAISAQAVQENLPQEGDYMAGGVVVSYNETTGKLLILGTDRYSSNLTWVQAERWATQNSSFGYGDWRLPSDEELEEVFSLVYDENNSIKKDSKLQNKLVRLGSGLPRVVANDYIKYWCQELTNSNEAILAHPTGFTSKPKTELGNNENRTHARIVRSFYLNKDDFVAHKKPIHKETSGVVFNSSYVQIQNSVIYEEDVTLGLNTLHSIPGIVNTVTKNGDMGTVSITTDVFESYHSGDYRPDLQGMLLQNGDTTGVSGYLRDYVEDLDGGYRIVEGQIDIGAYQIDLRDVILLENTTIKVKDKFYDGEVDATVEDWGAITGTDYPIDPRHDVRLDFSEARAEFSQSDAGDDLPIVFIGLKLVGDDADLYRLANPKGITATIEKALQEIHFPEIDDKLLSDEPFNVNAEVNSGLPLTYESSDENIATIDEEGTITIVSPGQVIITVIQEGNENYEYADQDRMLVITDNGSSDASLHGLWVNDNYIEVKDIMTYDLGAILDEAEIKIETNEYATIDRDKVSTEIIKNPTIHLVEFTITSQNELETNTYKLYIEKRFKFDEIINIRWNNTLTVVGNPTNNGGYNFNSYQWYKNDEEAGTGQYLTAGIDGEQLNPNDIYYVALTAEQYEGTVRSSEGSPKLESREIRIFPNPVSSNGYIHVETDMDVEQLQGAFVELYNTSGVVVKKMALEGQQTDIEVVGTSGIYILKLRLKDGFTKEMKIIVK